MRTLPIRVRLTIWYSAVLGGILVAVSCFLVIRLGVDLRRQLDETLTLRAQQIELGLTGPTEGEFQDVGDISLDSSLLRGDTAAQVFAPDGRLLQSAGGADIAQPLLDAKRVRKAILQARRETIRAGHPPERYRVLALPLPNRVGVLVVAASTDATDRAERRLALLLATADPVAVLVAAVGGYVLARRAFRPIDTMTQAAAEIGSDDPSRRLEVPARRDEVGRLALTLNQMLTRLQESLEEQQRFAADASHELRTPLSIMAGELDVSLRSASLPDECRPILASLRAEIDHMTRILEDLLLLARMDQGRSALRASRIDLLDLARRLVERFDSAASARGVHLSAQGRSVSVWADADQLARAVANLIDNALKHTPTGGSVTVGVDRNGRLAMVRIRDTGVGISPEDLPHVFDRFYRADKSRSRAEPGAGLGLSICRSIVRSHAGSVAIDSLPGEGTLVTVELPADEPD